MILSTTRRLLSRYHRCTTTAFYANNISLHGKLPHDDRSFSTSSVDHAREQPIKKVTIVGGGTMGAQIAQINAMNGYHVSVVDNDEYAQKCMVLVAKSLDILAKKKFVDEVRSQRKWYDSVIDNIKTTQYLPTGCDGSDLVIETVVEDIAIKRKKFLEIDKCVSGDCIVATNTSSLSVEEISEGVSERKRVVGLHFFNPAWKMLLLEVIGIDSTSQQTVDRMFKYAESIGKTAVYCKDTPGFIVNSLVYPYFMDAINLYERGHASVEDIDRAMKLGAGYPQGPFELMDMIGLDIVQQVIGNWYLKYPDDPRYLPSNTLNDLVRQGKLGMKTKQGFYVYKKSLY